MKKLPWLVLVVAIFGGVRLAMERSDAEERLALGWCDKPASLKARVEAEEAGLIVDYPSGCIRRPAPAAPRAAVVAPPPAAPDPAAGNLGLARKGFVTTLSGEPRPAQQLPEPPAALFVRADYASGPYPAMPAYVTPDPQDGKRHPAIIWIAGGDFSSFGDFWTPGGPDADESASQFREAGLVMMFPSLRGSANNASRPEYFLGEVDDVLAAAEHLARLPYVDPERIYLGGHSTGGTLALLVAESSARFKAVFALGPVASPQAYPASIAPSLRSPEGRELALREPINWLGGIASPTYVIEGRDSPGNIASLEALCEKSRNRLLHCVPVAGMNHFSVIAPAARVIAARLAIEAPGVPFSLEPGDVAR